MMNFSQCLLSIWEVPKGADQLDPATKIEMEDPILKNIVIWVWVNTYRYIFSGMNIHLPAILGFTRYQGFDPSPYTQFYIRKGWAYRDLDFPVPH